MADFDIISDIASTVQETLGLSARTDEPEHDSVILRGLTRFNFRVNVKLFVTGEGESGSMLMVKIAKILSLRSI